MTLAIVIAERDIIAATPLTTTFTENFNRRQTAGTPGQAYR